MSDFIRGVLFDKDGTLLDFHATWIPVYRQCADALTAQTGKAGLADELLIAGGYDLQTGRCAPASPLACGTGHDIAAAWAPVAGIADVDSLARNLDGQFLDWTRQHPVAAAPLAELFQQLKAFGMKLGVATMDTEAGARSALRTLAADADLDFVCGYDSGFGEKPGPGMVHAFCQHTSLTAAQVAVVGDTPHDLHMARAARAGMAVGVLTGASGRETLEPLADLVLESISGLVGALNLQPLKMPK